MPNEDDDINHDGKYPQTSAAVSTTSLKPAPTGLPSAVPTDVGGHRPVPPKLKPSTTSTSPEDTAQPVESNAAASSTATPAGWLSWLPTFGFGPKTTAWTYGALGLIIAFCGGLAIYFWWARKKAKRDFREGYEFEVLRDEEEGEGLKGTQGKRRAGELYDAFATGSDDDLDPFASDSDEDEIDQAYRDRSNEDVGAGAVVDGAGVTESKESLDRERYALGGESDEDSDEDDKLKGRQKSG